jgi:hypothetical protein
MDRKNKLLWMKDILEHLTDSVNDLQRAEADEERFLADAVQRDLEEFRRLFGSLRRDARCSAENRRAILV